MQHTDIAIAGAGVIGLATALELASTGQQVIVLERGQAMMECSAAAAGMLASTDPEGQPELRELCQLARDLYSGFLAKVERLSGKKVPIRTTKTLQGAPTLPPGAEPASPEAIRAAVPALRADTNSLEYFFLEEQSFDPRDLAVALPLAVQTAGVIIREYDAVKSVRPQANFVQVITSSGEYHASHFINTCGAWATGLSGVPIVPRKGQIVLVELAESTGHQLTVALRTPDVYLVPRGDGRIIIGSTVEDAGFNTQVDPAIISGLLAAAAELWPPIREARTLDAWAGLRPASADLLPVIGGHGPNSWLSIGHFRNGILLAPASALLLRQMILAEPLGIDPSAFSPDRFAPASVRD